MRRFSLRLSRVLPLIWSTVSPSLAFIINRCIRRCLPSFLAQAYGLHPSSITNHRWRLIRSRSQSLISETYPLLSCISVNIKRGQLTPPPLVSQPLFNRCPVTTDSRSPTNSDMPPNRLQDCNGGGSGNSQTQGRSAWPRKPSWHASNHCSCQGCNSCRTR